jgi:hypothetical protein
VQLNADPPAGAAVTGTAADYCEEEGI